MFQCLKRTFCCSSQKQSSNPSTYILKLANDKYYVGESNDIQRRIWVHENGNGSAWTKKHNVIQRMNTINNQNNNFDELSQTLLMMNRFGIDNVRGSLFTSPFPLTDFEKIMAAKLYCELNGLCLKCGGSDHFITNCTNQNVEKWVENFGGKLQYESLTNERECIVCKKDISSSPSNYKYCRSCFFKTNYRK